jgi:hypothetical protein
LSRIAAHPVVAPLAEERWILQAKRTTTAQDLQAARVRLATLSASPDTTPKDLRLARQTLDGLMETMEDLDSELRSLAGPLEEAESAARGELRAPLRTEAAARLYDVIVAMEGLEQAQAALAQVHAQAQRLGIGLAGAHVLDGLLPARLKSARKILEDYRQTG